MTEGETRIRMWQWGVATVVAGVCLLSGLDAIGLVGPDEPRYAEVAREMAASGDWVTPRLWGAAWFEKPVLYYWGAAAAMRVFGANEFGARLPAALAALMALLGLAWAALRQYGPREAWAVALIFPTSAGVIGFARAAGPDMPFAASLALAMVVAASLVLRSDEEKKGATGLRIELGVALGAATLAKGPAAIVLAGGSVLLWAAATRRWRAAFGLLHPWAIAAWAITALPWYVLCARRNPEFVRVFLYEHNFERYLTPVFRHEQPMWFFVPVVLIGVLPWTALLAGAARDGWQAWKEKKWVVSPAFFYACWAVWPVVFFSLSKSKLPGYVLPAVAPLAIVMARSVARRAESKDRWAVRLTIMIGITVVMLSALAAAITYGNYLEEDIEDKVSVPLLLVIAVLGLGVILFARAYKISAALFAVGLVLTGSVGVLTWRVLGRLDAYTSARQAARSVGGEPANENLYVYQVRRAWEYGLEFYQKKKLPEWREDAALPSWVFTTRAGIAEMEKAGRAVRVVEGRSGEAMLVYVYR